MSLGQCIPGMIARGEIDQARGDRMATLFAKLEAHYARDMSPSAASAVASEETLRQLEFEAAQTKRQKLIQIDAQRRAAADMDSYKGTDRYAAIAAMIDTDAKAPYAGMERAAERIEFQMQAKVAGFIERHRRNLAGRPMDVQGLNDVVVELHGGASGNARAKVFAQAIGEVQEYLRKRFNAAGGAIGKLEGFGLPHRHDTLKVRRAGYETWRADILAGIDPNRMRDPATGGELTEERLEEGLREAFENIRTNGLRGEPSTNPRGAGNLANRHADHRFFHFRDGAAWLAYHAKYGNGNAFEAVMGHIKSMSHDIAAMERLGPNPDATVRWLLDRADIGEAASARAAPAAVSGQSAARARVEKLWRYVKGEYNIPVVYEGFAAPVLNGTVATLHATRDLLTAGLLGSSPLTAISDMNTQAMARKMNGLPEVSMISGYLRQLNPASHEDRRLAIRLGLGMRDAAHSLQSVQRFMDTGNGPAWSKVVADSVLRLSGLNKFTEAGQRAFGMSLLGHLADIREQGFDALTPRNREMLERYGIDAGLWDHIRSAEPVEQGGAEYMSFANIDDQRASDRMMDMVLGETDAAVQVTSASDRALLVWDRPGTLGGETAKSVLQFKSFAFALMRTQANRIAAMAATRGAVPAAVYAAQFFIGMTLFGGAALQLREIAKGRDPRPMDNAEFWADAAAQGGGIGIFGDLIGSFFNDRIDGVMAFVGGPITGLAQDLSKTVKAKNKGAAAVRLAKRYLPGNNIWYSRLAFERLIIDRLSEMADPYYRLSWARMERRAEEQGQDYWWSPGEDAPERGPDVQAAISASN